MTMERRDLRNQLQSVIWHGDRVVKRKNKMVWCNTVRCSGEYPWEPSRHARTPGDIFFIGLVTEASWPRIRHNTKNSACPLRTGDAHRVNDRRDTTFPQKNKKETHRATPPSRSTRACPHTTASATCGTETSTTCWQGLSENVAAVSCKFRDAGTATKPV